MSISNEIRKLAANIRGHDWSVMLDRAADEIDRLTHALTEATAGDDRAERERHAEIEQIRSICGNPKGSLVDAVQELANEADAAHADGAKHERESICSWIDRAFGDYVWRKTMVASIRRGDHEHG